MYHYTYLLQSKTSDMMYIGVRSCECIPEEDIYWGSSKYLPENVSDICDKFILRQFETREEALADEVRLHKNNDVARNPNFWNRACQLTTGFDSSGTKHTEDTKQKIAKAHKGKSKPTLTEEHKQKLSESLKGRKQPHRSKEHSENISNALTGRNLTEEHKQKVSDYHSGKKRSEETKQKMRDAWVMRKQSSDYDEYRKQISERQTGSIRLNARGKPLTEKHKQKLSESAKKRWAKVKSDVNQNK